MIPYLGPLTAIERGHLSMHNTLVVKEHAEMQDATHEQDQTYG